jgi:hypothetical protein
MSANFVSGDHCQLKTNATTVPADQWELNIDAKLKEVHNSRDGRKRIRGKADSDGNFHIWYDTGSGQQPTDPAGAGIIEGAVVTGQFYIDSTHFYALQIIIGKISPAIGGFDEAAGIKVEFALESGSVTYPTLP